MSSTWRMKKNDLLPVLEVTLRDEYGEVDLTSASSAVFRMSTPTDVAANNAPKVSAAAVIDPDQVTNKGKVSYTWVSGDTDTADTYYAEIIVTYGSKTITYPNGGYYEVIILEDVNN